MCVELLTNGVCKANSICHELLIEPRLGRVYRASLHIILAHSPDENFMWHANEAVRLYEAMYTDPGKRPPTEDQLQSKMQLVRSARAVQTRCLEEEKALAGGPTEEEKMEWLQQVFDEMDEREEEMAREYEEWMESGDIDAEEPGDEETGTEDDEMSDTGDEEEQAGVAVSNKNAENSVVVPRSTAEDSSEGEQEEGKEEDEEVEVAMVVGDIDNDDNVSMLGDNSDDGEDEVKR